MRISNLLKLIKRSSKARVLIGGISVIIVGTGIVGGVTIYNNYKQKNVAKLELEEQQVLGNKIKTIKEYAQTLEPYVNNSLGCDAKKSLEDFIVQLDSAIQDKDFGKYEEIKQEADKQIETLVKYNREFIEKNLKQLDEIDFNKLPKEWEAKVEDTKKSCNTHISDNKFIDAQKVIDETMTSLTLVQKEIAEKENVEKGTAEKDIASGNSSNKTSQPSKGTSSGSANSTSSQSSKGTSSGGTSSTSSKPSTPASKPTETPNTKPTTPAKPPTSSKRYELTEEKEAWWSRHGINIQSKEPFTPFFDNYNKTWNIILDSSNYLDNSKSTKYSNQLIELMKKDFPDKSYAVSGGYFGNYNGVNMYTYMAYVTK